MLLAPEASLASKFSSNSSFNFQQTLAGSQEKYFKEHPFKTRRGRFINLKTITTKQEVELHDGSSLSPGKGLCKQKVMVPVQGCSASIRP